MAHTKVIVFILILLAIAVSNGQTNPTGTQSLDQGQTTAGTGTTTDSVQTSFIKGTIITYCGEEDASFDLTNSSDIQIVEQMLTNLSSVSQPDWPQFGFRGYGLENHGIASFLLYVRVFEGVIQIFEGEGSNFYQDSNGLESFLSQKANSTMSQSTTTQMLVKRDAPAPAKTLPTTGSELPYEPEKWNKAPVIEQNNCYRYVTNMVGDSFASPGLAGGKELPSPEDPGFNCDNLVAAAESDGLVTVNCDDACPKCSYKIAVAINPKTDFHWYRQDNTGNWSHKTGATEVTNVDNSKKPIVDPRTADRGPFKTFCACFCVLPKKVKIRDVGSAADVCVGGD